MVSSKFRWLFHMGIIGLLLAITPSAYALGLGSLQLESRLNQRFSAAIPVLVAEDVAASDIDVRLASNDQFKRAGFLRTGSVLKLRFSPVRREDGQMYILVNSSIRITDPLINFVIEVQQGGDRTLRQYTALLEAPTK